MLWTPTCNHNFEVKSFIIFYSLESLALPISMEEHLEGEGSALYCFLHLDGSFGLNSHN
jgi:hypothetical protein